jgi:hypothetical protein
VGAASLNEARQLSLAVADSLLVKSSVFGADPYAWGRILAALGARAGKIRAAFHVGTLSLELQGVRVFDNGRPLHDAPGLARLKFAMQEPVVKVLAELRQGTASARAWGCDLTYDYVKMNADYARATTTSAEGSVAVQDRLSDLGPSIKKRILIEALRYIDRFDGLRAVIKLGGAAMLDHELEEQFAEDVILLQSVGLKPIVVDVESYAMRSALERLIGQLPNGGEGLVIAVFYVGANTTSVTVMHDGEAIYEREQPFGGQQLTGDIARTYGIPAEEAELKKRSGDLPANYENEVLRPFIDAAATEITRALQFFFTSTPYTRVDQIMLSGGSAVLAGLPEALMERAQVPTSVISPFKGMEISSGVRDKQLRLDAPALLTPCGLAMRRFDK